MPKGDNPNSRANLKRGGFTAETASKNGKKGAAASNEKQKEKRTVREIAIEIASASVMDYPQLRELAKRVGLKTDASIKELMVFACLGNTLKRGNIDDAIKMMELFGEQNGGTNNGILDELTQWLTEAGLVDLRVFGDRTMEPPKEDEQPVAFIVIVKKANAIAFADVDVGIAAHTIALTAWSYGVGSCMLGSINIPKIRELLDVPEEDQIRLAIALGKPSHTSTIVPVGEDGKTDYYLDEDRNYCVPKRAFEDVVHFA